ncbi:MAG: DUF2065 domain-containing protein [Pseudomonadota bacterium]
MTDLFVALGLVLVIEGLIWALIPGYARRTLEAIEELGEGALRITAVGAVAIGVLIVWLARSW